MKLDVEPDRLISAPETLSDGELTLQLLPAKSGETDDALFIQDPKHGLLLVGDAFMPYLEVFVRGRGLARGLPGVQSTRRSSSDLVASSTDTLH